MPNFELYSALAIQIAALAAAAVFYVLGRRARARLVSREIATNRRMYELAILKELGERIGYSLQMQNIAEIITGSLHQFIGYSVASHMILDQEKIIFRAHLERSVSRKFIAEVRDRMLKSLGALLNRDLQKIRIEEILSGAIIVEELDEPVRSFFNIPLAVGSRVVGVLTVAHTVQDLYHEEEMTILYKITRRASETILQLENVVKTEERKLNAMVESMAEGVLMTDTDYRVVVANQAAKRAVGLAGREEISIFDLIDAMGGKFDIRGQLEESVKLKKESIAEDVVLGERVFKILVAPVRAASGSASEILGGLVLFEDTTREKELARLREDFTSMIVHELRSPLDNIKKLSELMEIKNAVPDPESLRMIHANSSRMLEMVNDLLDAAKIEAGKFQVFSAPHDLGALIAERIRFYAAAAGEAGVSLNAVLDPALPGRFPFDAMRIGQVLNNLISNALKFTPSGGTVNIQALRHKKGNDIRAEALGAGVEWLLSELPRDLPESAVVAATDTGAGMAADDIPHLFSKFAQFKAARKYAYKGTGLGLAVAKGIVEAHGGTIGAVSREGGGSTVYFTLPLPEDASPVKHEIEPARSETDKERAPSPLA